MQYRNGFVFLGVLLYAGCPQSFTGLAGDEDGDGYVSIEQGGDDCDDGDVDVNPGSPEVCDDAVDNDCDGQVDDQGLGGTPYYADVDQDGAGDPLAIVAACDGEAPDGYVADDSDCDDTRADVGPHVKVDTCDQVDNDCDDEVDEDGGASLDGVGYATLAEAIGAANGEAGADIMVCPGVLPSETIELTGAEDLVIRGAGAAATQIRSAGGEPVFDLSGSARLSLRELAVQGSTSAAALRVSGSAVLGLVDAEVSDNPGGGLRMTVEAGRPAPETTLTRVLVADNGGPTVLGGGLSMTGGLLTLADSEVRDNDASFGGGLHAIGGELQVVDTPFTSNTAVEAGGGLFLRATTATATRSAVTGNEALEGAGLAVASGTWEATDSVVGANTALDKGGAMWLDDASVAGTNLVLEDNGAAEGGAIKIEAGESTLSGIVMRRNSAQIGAAVDMDGGVQLTLQRCSLVSNTATIGGGAVWIGGTGGTTLDSTATDWGTPEIDDNTPNDIDHPVAGGVNLVGVLDVSCDDAGC